MHSNHGIHMLLTFTLITLCMLMCTLVHIVDVRATLLNFAMIRYMMQLNLFGLGNELTPMDPKEYEYQRPPLVYLM